MSEFGFKVPVSGQKIPHGWFAALVRFMNSLILSGDGTWTMVSRDEAGTQVTLTPSAVAALKKAAGGAPGAGAAQDLSVSVSDNTATVGISGSTSHVDFVAGSNVSITGNTAGPAVLNATAITGMPNYFYSSPQFVSVNSSAPVIVPAQSETMFLIGEAGVYTSSNMSGTVYITIGYLTLALFSLTIGSSSVLSGLTTPVFLPIPAGHSFQLSASGAGAGSFHLYPAL